MTQTQPFSLPFAPNDIHAVIFDMDGLLLDSERVALATVAEAAAELGVAWRHEVGLALVGLNSKDGPAVIRQHLGEDYPTAELYDTFGRLYEVAIAEGRIPLKGGVTALFDVLDALGLGRVVATSTRRSRAEPKLAAVGLLPRVHGMVCGDEVSRGKPAPDIFLAAAARLGVAGGELPGAGRLQRRRARCPGGRHPGSDGARPAATRRRPARRPAYRWQPASTT
jgi:beta-phosphoglucomutase-like phosphatase (HAD superfamily)